MNQPTRHSFFSKIPQSIFLILVWLVFTSSLAIWWWIYSLRELQLTTNDQTNYSGKHMMIMGEGFILVMMIVLGGSYLLHLIIRDQKRHERLKFFFSAFNHDIKTSISRLRLQSDILAESEHNNPILKRLSEDIQRLDLQLENSLLLTNPDGPLLLEKTSLQNVIQVIRQEFPEVNFELNQNISLLADSKALMLLFRNIIQNAIIHGQASQIHISAGRHPLNPELAQLIISNDGAPYKGDFTSLGKDILSSHHQNGNGLGLLIVRNLAKKMGGDAEFQKSASQDDGFQIQLHLRRVQE